MHALHFRPFASYRSLSSLLSFFVVPLPHFSFTIQLTAIWLLLLTTSEKTHQNSRKGLTNSNAHKGQKSYINEYVNHVCSQIGYVETSGKPESRCLAKGILNSKIRISQIKYSPIPCLAHGPSDLF